MVWKQYIYKIIIITINTKTMTKTKLSISELLQLQAELVGNQNVKGLLALKLNMLAKYRLSQLYKVVSEELSVYQKINDELIQKFGEEKDGGFVIPAKITEHDKHGETYDIDNPNIELYLAELNPILADTKELDLPEIYVSDLKDAESEGFYPLFFEKILKDK